MYFCGGDLAATGGSPSQAGSRLGGKRASPGRSSGQPGDTTKTSKRSKLLIEEERENIETRKRTQKGLNKNSQSLELGGSYFIRFIDVEVEGCI